MSISGLLGMLLPYFLQKTIVIKGLCRAAFLPAINAAQSASSLTSCSSIDSNPARTTTLAARNGLSQP